MTATASGDINGPEQMHVRAQFDLLDDLIGACEQSGRNR